MKQQPDKLFREKLHSHSKTPSPLSWDRIEASLEKRETRFPLRAIAASLLLIAVFAYALWPQDEINPEAVAIKNTEPSVQESTGTSTVKQESNDKEASEINNESNSSPASPIKEEVKRQTEKPTTSPEARPPVPEQLLTDGHAGTGIINEANNGGAEPLPSNSETAVLAFQSKPVEEHKHENIVLVLSAEDTKGYLKKEKREATSDEKKSSTLRKLLKKASDFTNDQDPIGDLRQRKNEILALNFGAEKRGQKK